MKLFLSLGFLLFSIISFAQSTAGEVIANGGEFYENGNGSLSWTLGEPVIETISNGTNTLTQGFQQNSYTITEISEVMNPEFNIRVYPNPTSDIINIDGKDLEIGTIEMFDMNGKLVLSEEINDTCYQLNIQDKTVAYYLLKIYSKKSNIVKEYKICKTQ